MGKPSAEGPVLLADQQHHSAKRTIGILTNAITDTVLWRNRDELVTYIERANLEANAQCLVPKLAVLDLLSPSGGLEVLHALKSGRKTRHVPAVVIAGGQDEAALLKAFLTKGNGFVVRPLTAKKLAGVARRLGLQVQ